MRLISLDPGGTTGIAYWDSAEPEEIDTEQIGPGPHHEVLWDRLEAWLPDVVICERFMYQRRELTKGVSLVLDSVEYIGIVKLWCGDSQRFRPLIIQTPAQAKNFWTDEKLKTIGRYKANAPHANDAVRHLLYYLVIELKQVEWLHPLRPD